MALILLGFTPNENDGHPSNIVAWMPTVFSGFIDLTIIARKIDRFYCITDFIEYSSSEFQPSLVTYSVSDFIDLRSTILARKIDCF